MRIVDAAMSLIGKRYQDKARGPQAYDCIGVVCHAYTAAGLHIEDVSGYPALPDGRLISLILTQVKANGGQQVPFSDAKGGDLVVMAVKGDRLAGHCGLLHHDGELIHASAWAKRVVKGRFDDRLYHPVAAFSVAE